jgi:hypothetical protein
MVAPMSTRGSPGVRAELGSAALRSSIDGYRSKRVLMRLGSLLAAGFISFVSVTDRGIGSF